MSLEPYWRDEHVALHLGDHRDVLPQLGETFDLIVADPPYGETSLDWDRWLTGWPAFMADYGRSMWCFGSLRMYLQRRDEFAGWKLSQDLVWEKHNGSSLARDRFRRVHELPTFWYLGAWADRYHDVPTTPDAVARRVHRRALPPQHQGARGPSSYESVDGGPRLMTSVLRVRSMHGSAINETEKPGGLLEPLISYACPPGGIVLDPFGGSASTAVVARNLGRRAVVIEKRESQCEKAAQRLSQAPLDFGSLA